MKFHIGQKVIPQRFEDWEANIKWLSEMKECVGIETEIFEQAGTEAPMLANGYWWPASALTPVGNDLQAENERLREALRGIATYSHSQLFDDEIITEMRKIATKALNNK